MEFDCRVLSVSIVRKKMNNTTDQWIGPLHGELSELGSIVDVSLLKVEMMELES